MRGSEQRLKRNGYDEAYEESCLGVMSGDQKEHDAMAQYDGRTDMHNLNLLAIGMRKTP